MKKFISTWSHCFHGKAHLLRSYEHTEGPKMKYQNRNHLTLLVTKITSWLELEIKTSSVKSSVFFYLELTREFFI